MAREGICVLIEFSCAGLRTPSVHFVRPDLYPAFRTFGRNTVGAFSIFATVVASEQVPKTGEGRASVAIPKINRWFFVVFFCRQKWSLPQLPGEQSASSDEDNSAAPPQPTIIHSYYRTGCMAAFESFAMFESYFDEILDLVEDFSSTSTVSNKIMEAVENAGSESQSTSINVSLSVDAPPRSPKDDQIQVLSWKVRKFWVFGFVKLDY